MEQMAGKKFLDGSVEATPEYVAEPDAVAKQEMKDEFFSVFTTFLFLDGADRRKYGSLLDGFATQYSLGNNQWPTTLEDASEILSVHKLDAGWSRSTSASGRKMEVKNDKTFAQSETEFVKKCNCCGDPGHLSPECPEKNTRPASRWFRPKYASRASKALVQGETLVADKGETVLSSTDEEPSARDQARTSACRERKAARRKAKAKAGA